MIDNNSNIDELIDFNSLENKLEDEIGFLNK
jgi:hypothetical protein